MPLAEQNNIQNEKPPIPEIHEALTQADPGQQGDEDFDPSSTRLASGQEPKKPRKPPSHSKKRNRVARELDHLDGKTLSGYEIHEMLGAGGMGAVFRARQVSLDRNVAVKVLPERLAKNSEALARFTREALSAAQLNHPNIVQVFDVISSGGYHFIVMEHVPGLSLSQIVRKNGPYSAHEATGLILQAARGLAYAHKHNIIHRDIKPDNLLLCENGVLKIADMGLAKSIHDLTLRSEQGDDGTDSDGSLDEIGNITGTRRGLGTPAYMPPEQATGAADVDGRADQYALGCTLYYLITAHPPFTAKKPEEYIEKHHKDPVPKLQDHDECIPYELDKIYQRLMAKYRDDRFERIEDLIEDLEDVLKIDSGEGEQSALRQRDLDAIENAQRDYHAVPLNKITAWTKIFAGCIIALLTGIILLSGNIRDAFLLAIFGVTLFLSGFVLHGIFTGDYLFRNIRHLFLDRPLQTWLSQSLLVGLLSALAFIIMPDLAIVTVTGITGGVLYEILICRYVRRRKTQCVQSAEEHLRRMRLRGLNEEELQDFIAEYGGRNWEAFFEEIFGYEALIETVQRLKEQRKSNIHFNGIWMWRSKIIEIIETIEEKRRTRRERRTMERAERQRLRSQGLDRAQAQKQARKEARIFGKEMSQKRAKNKKSKQKKVKKASVTKAQKKPKPRRPDIEHSPSLWDISAAQVIWSAIRAIVGLILLALGVLPLFDPMFNNSWLTQYYHMGHPSTLFGAAAGLALVLTAFSSQIFAPLLILFGSILITAHNRLDSIGLMISSHLGPVMLFFAGLTFVISGFILTILGWKKRD